MTMENMYLKIQNQYSMYIWILLQAKGNWQDKWKPQLQGLNYYLQNTILVWLKH